ncbi:MULTISPECIES: hypothetical protein [unclassified Mesorhizobium]|uniref:hypothetical protein n=1 Tax=unclassified Mesorhizobium TaxID=325217 RepID=UPI001CCF36F7|nr:MULTISPECIES: hypothetical protein [unclassified Mesorhizobium]MBZ9742218.1 hypothetical protein [Mesorhizobium sp. CO1-1-4]MBZ9805823.1 hypothetical protein [Mesorhizobium sp. ES1-6]MBZ9996228.1 hypothetical protein [Mesorhizobium sp. BH1-1-4]
MNIKSICICATFMLSICGQALAGILDEPDTMTAFFTDSSMKTMKPREEFERVFLSMPVEKQAKMKGECAGEVMQPFTAFCANVNTLGGQH